MPLAMPTILVIDDDPTVSLLARQAADDPDLRLLSAATLQEGFELASRHRPDVVVLDVMLPDGTGLDLYQRLKQLDAKLPVLFVTTRGTSHTAIEAMRLGAFDFLPKPLELGELRRLLTQALEIRRLMRVPVEIRETSELKGSNADLLIGRTPAMQEVYKAIGRVAGRDVPVLLRGETGTGKQLVARALYHYGNRAAGTYHAVHCGMEESALEAELFGHENPGSRTEKPRAGKVEQAIGGTLFLDEIGDLTPTLQSKVLTLLEEGRFQRIGGNTELASDVRLIAATSRDLEKLVASGKFRPDLFYRLSQCMISVPPLRERLEDLPALANHILAQGNERLSRRVCRISPEAMDRLERHNWPGNVRELESVLHHALVRAAGAVLLVDFLPDDIAGRTPTMHASPRVGETDGALATDWTSFLARRLEAGSAEVYAEATAEMDRQLLTLVLRHTEGNQARAAQILGMTRGSLRAKIRALGIMIDRLVNLPLVPAGSTSEDA